MANETFGHAVEFLHYIVQCKNTMFVGRSTDVFRIAAFPKGIQVCLYANKAKFNMPLG